MNEKSIRKPSMSLNYIKDMFLDFPFSVYR